MSRRTACRLLAAFKQAFALGLLCSRPPLASYTMTDGGMAHCQELFGTLVTAPVEGWSCGTEPALLCSGRCVAGTKKAC